MTPRKAARIGRIAPGTRCPVCRKPVITHTDPRNPESDHIDPKEL